MIEILNPDLTPFDNLIPDFQAGEDSAPIPFAIRNTGPDQHDLLLVVQADNPATGLPVSTGVPPLDELWTRIRLTGQDTTHAPAQQLELHDWTPIGAARALHIASLHQGGIRLGEIRFRPPATAASLTWRFHLAVVAAEHSHPVGVGVRQGILIGFGDHGYSALLRGFQVTAATEPAAQVHVAAGQVVYRGRLLGQVGTTVDLDQLDGGGEPLEPGQLYRATLSTGPAGLTVTKSPRGVDPTRPAPPAWEPALAAITVRHQAEASEIEPTDIEDLRIFDRYHAEPGPGLQLRIHAGRAIARGTLRYHSTPTTLQLPPNATTCLYQRANGAWELTPATAPPPETTALGPLWIATTDAEGVTDLQDRRTYAADTVVLHLRGPLPATPGLIAETLVVHDGLIMEDVLYRLSDNGGGTAGQTKLDLLLEGASLYPSAAQDDQRPGWSFDAADLRYERGTHEIAELHPGELLQLTTIEHPTGSAPIWSEVHVLCRRR
jgi:hypothetical protein